jgi:murein endopeptidase
MITDKAQEHLGVVARALSLAGIVTIWTLFGSGAEVTTVEAQQGPAGSTHGGSVVGSLRLAASGFGPVPTNTILGPGTLERIAKRIRQQRWSVPDADKVWPTHDESPVIQTKQIDELWHTVEPGQTLHRLRQMYKVSTYQLRTLNPNINLGALDAGERLQVWKRDDEAVSASYGAASRGRLYNAEPLPDDEKYVVLYPHRTFGTYYTVSEVRRILDNFYEAYPRAHKLMIGDISFRRGRGMHPHKSHRSGRDIDISYPRLDAPPTYRRFHYVRRDELDVKKTLSLIKDLIDGGHVEYIFMDRWFQKMLRKEALAQGATKKWAQAVFQYPDWHGGTALIRHASGHRNHFHIRFKCQSTDRRCH